MTEAKPTMEEQVARNASALGANEIFDLPALIAALREQARWNVSAAEWLDISQRVGVDLANELKDQRIARLAAEARVKVLEEALRRIDSLIPADCHLDGMADAALRGLLLMIGDQIAALKAREPANG